MLTATNLMDGEVFLRSVSFRTKGVMSELIESGVRNWTVRVTAGPQTGQIRFMR